jgi:hypothetical protein
VRLIQSFATGVVLLAVGVCSWLTCAPLSAPRHAPGANASASAVSIESVAPARTGAEPRLDRPAAQASAEAVVAASHAAPNGTVSVSHTTTGALLESSVLGPVGSGNPSAGAQLVTGANGTDSRSLALVAGIERDLHRSAPPEVRALLREFEQGADRQRLLSLLDQTLAKELSLKLYVRRWLDQVAPDPRKPTPPKRSPLFAPGGSGSHSVRVLPVSPK